MSKRVLADLGPDLGDIFLPGVGLAARAGAMVVGDRGASKRPSAAFAGSAAALAITDSVSGNEQSRIFEQVTSVLTSLAEQKPLILILDDLHWVDDSSAEEIREAARRNGVPADVIVEVGELSELGAMGGVQPERFSD